MAEDSMIDSALQGVQGALRPLSDALASREAFADLLERFGWTIDESAGADEVAAAFGPLVAKLRAVVDAEPEELLVLVPALLADFKALERAAAAAAYPLDQPEFWTPPADSSVPDESFPREIIDYLLYDYCETNAAGLFGLLKFAGVFDEEAMPGGPLANVGAPPRGPYIRRIVDWSRLPRYVGDPAGAFLETYSWNSPVDPFKHARFLRNLSALLRFLPATVATDALSRDMRSLYYDSGPDLPAGMLQVVLVPLLEPVAPSSLDTVKLAVVLMPVPPNGVRSGAPVGFSVFPVVSGGLAARFDFTETVSLALSGDMTVVPVQVEIRPDGVSLSELSLEALADRTSVRASAVLTASFPEDAPKLLFGAPTSSRLELYEAHLGLGVNGAVSSLEYTIEAVADRARIVIDLSQADGFLTKFLGSEPRGIDVPFGVAWSSKTGFSFCGRNNFSAEIAVHQTFLDVIRIDVVKLAAGPAPDGEGAELAAAATIGLIMGPFAASVKEMGLKLSLRSGQDGRGNLGDLDLAFGFKPPTGASLVIDSGAIVGGGFLDIDSDKGQYAGFMQLQMYGIAVTAMGLIATRTPDGRKVFSLLVVISARFPPVQLSFGFTLDGVGGLLGVERTMNVRALQDGVRAGTLDAMLFPELPIRDPQALVSTVGAFFPVASDRYVLGPMMMLGWGTPPIIRAELGLLLEVPSPVRLAIIGQFSASLPSLEVPVALIELHLDILGAIDFGAKKAGIDATLYDSRVVQFSLSGDMALRLAWGDKPNFAVAFGGFNPRFKPPADFPALRRLQISIGAGDNPRISLQGYFALTSNSAQFGSKLEVLASKGGFSVYGYMGFDALFIFVPFSFVVDIGAGVDLRKGSRTIMAVHLEFTLSGPTPWHAYGKASVNILFFSVSVSFDAKWGREDAASLPPIDPLPELLRVLGEQASWTAELPPASLNLFVTLRERETGEIVRLLHPVGTVTIQQKVLPLGHPITKFGNAPAEGAHVYDLTSALASEPVKEHFAPAQFEVMSDAEKLSREAFEEFEAGLRLRAASASDEELTPIRAQMLYETKYVDEPDRTRPKFRPLSADLMKSLGASSRRAKAGGKKYASGRGKLVSLAEPVFVVAGVDDLRISDVAPEGSNQAQAVARLKKRAASRPGEAVSLQVVPREEAA